MTYDLDIQADRADRTRERADLAGTACEHFTSWSYTPDGCDECWDNAYNVSPELAALDFAYIVTGDDDRSCPLDDGSATDDEWRDAHPDPRTADMFGHTLCPCQTIDAATYAAWMSDGARYDCDVTTS